MKISNKGTPSFHWRRTAEPQRKVALDFALDKNYSLRLLCKVERARSNLEEVKFISELSTLHRSVQLDLKSAKLVYKMSTTQT